MLHRASVSVREIPTAVEVEEIVWQLTLSILNHLSENSCCDCSTSFLSFGPIQLIVTVYPSIAWLVQSCSRAGMSCRWWNNNTTWSWNYTSPQEIETWLPPADTPALQLYQQSISVPSHRVCWFSFTFIWLNMNENTGETSQNAEWESKLGKFPPSRRILPAVTAVKKVLLFVYYNIHLPMEPHSESLLHSWWKAAISLNYQQFHAFPFFLFVTHHLTDKTHSTIILINSS